MWKTIAKTVVLALVAALAGAAGWFVTKIFKLIGGFILLGAFLLTAKFYQ